MEDSSVLMGLPVELLRLIIQYADVRTLCQLCLSSQALRAVSEELLYRNIRLGQERFSKSTTRVRLLVRTLLSRPDLCRHIRAIYRLTTDPAKPVTNNQYSEEFESRPIGGISNKQDTVSRLLEEDDYGRREMWNVELYPDLFHKLLLRLASPHLEQLWIHMVHLGMPTVREKIGSRYCPNVKRLVVDLTGFQSGLNDRGPQSDTFLKLFDTTKLQALHVKNPVNLSSGSFESLVTAEIAVYSSPEHHVAVVEFLRGCTNLKHLSLAFQNEASPEFAQTESTKFIDAIARLPVASRISHLRLKNVKHSFGEDFLYVPPMRNPDGKTGFLSLSTLDIDFVRGQRPILDQVVDDSISLRSLSLENLFVRKLCCEDTLLFTDILFGILAGAHRFWPSLCYIYIEVDCSCEPTRQKGILDPAFCGNSMMEFVSGMELFGKTVGVCVLRRRMEGSNVINLQAAPSLLDENGKSLDEYGVLPANRPRMPSCTDTQRDELLGRWMWRDHRRAFAKADLGTDSEQSRNLKCFFGRDPSHFLGAQ